MAARIDFASLSLMDALDLAILIEDEAKERYEDFAAQMEQHRTPEAAKFFRLMAVNEATHGISDTLLSVVGFRAKRVLDDLRAEPRTPARSTALAHPHPVLSAVTT